MISSEAVSQSIRTMRAGALKVRRPARERVFPWLLVVCGVVGLLAAFILSVDAIKIAAHPNAALDCNINPVISCGSVMRTSEASVVGFANSLLGIPAFTVVLVLGILSLSGAVVKRWIWGSLAAGAFGGVIFTHWLMYQSIYRIHALCPYCMVTWVVTMLVFLYTLAHVLPDRYAGRFLRRHHLDIFFVWLLILAALIGIHFWYYFRTWF